MKSQKDIPEEPFDPDSEPPVESDELDFSTDEEQSFNQLSPELDSTETEIINEDDTQPIDMSDDLEPEDLINEDGACSPREPSADLPADEDLTIVDADEIGAGYGLDEAELAHVKPLDGKPLDGKPEP
ncbi:hypothetical protein GCM10011613_24640 [Cellvibrio zantedeschiae]|uniref:Serine kinase/phosphatase n=1 Tax=Cellvibrio zantedeschiae TaxID=1237077 RepID=A0ABQ3B434_9GAMM|nr:serine kinase/phosphatase [Cellvibrio zantedeschiae]GGY78939.1 hypothetical protein GCM10011613_24640 [Cellvibrio zantedeschiae]